MFRKITVRTFVLPSWQRVTFRAEVPNCAAWAQVCSSHISTLTVSACLLCVLGDLGALKLLVDRFKAGFVLAVCHIRNLKSTLIYEVMEAYINHRGFPKGNYSNYDLRFFC